MLTLLLIGTPNCNSNLFFHKNCLNWRTLVPYKSLAVSSPPFVSASVFEGYLVILLLLIHEPVEVETTCPNFQLVSSFLPPLDRHLRPIESNSIPNYNYLPRHFQFVIGRWLGVLIFFRSIFFLSRSTCSPRSTLPRRSL